VTTGPIAGWDIKRDGEDRDHSISGRVVPDDDDAWEYYDGRGSRWGLIKPKFFGFRYGIYKSDANDVTKESKIGFEIRHGCGTTPQVWAERIATFMSELGNVPDPNVQSQGWDNLAFSRVSEWAVRRHAGDPVYWRATIQDNPTQLRLDAALIALAAWKTNQIDIHVDIHGNPVYHQFLRDQITHRTILCYMSGLESIRQADDDNAWADLLEANADEFADRVARLTDMHTVMGQVVTAANNARHTGLTDDDKLDSILNAGRARAADAVDVDGRHNSFGFAGMEVARFFHYRVLYCLRSNPGLVAACSNGVALRQFNTGLYSLYFMVAQPKCREVNLAAAR